MTPILSTVKAIVEDIMLDLVTFVLFIVAMEIPYHCLESLVHWGKQYHAYLFEGYSLIPKSQSKSLSTCRCM